MVVRRQPGAGELMARCKHVKDDGERCRRSAIDGGVVCTVHGGQLPMVKAKAAVRAEVMRWGLGDTTVDASEVLLRLLTQSAARAERYAQEVERLVSQAPSLEDALIGESRVLVGNELEKVGEYVRGMAELEAQERDRCAGFAVKAIAAGLAERQVRIAEQQGVLIADLIRRVLDDPDLALTAAQRRIGRQAAARHLRLAS